MDATAPGPGEMLIAQQAAKKVTQAENSTQRSPKNEASAAVLRALAQTKNRN